MEQKNNSQISWSSSESKLKYNMQPWTIFSPTCWGLISMVKQKKIERPARDQLSTKCTWQWPRKGDSNPNVCGLVTHWSMRTNHLFFNSYFKSPFLHSRAFAKHVHREFGSKNSWWLPKPYLILDQKVQLPSGSFHCGKHCATCPYISDGLTSCTFFYRGNKPS